jgi:type I restriction enzyme R subunit
VFRKSRSISEKETRKKLIDRRLEYAGWGQIASYNKNQNYKNESVTEYKTAKGPADYVLFHNGKPLAIVEAKRLAVGPQNVLKQGTKICKWISC